MAREPHLTGKEASAGRKIGVVRYILAISLLAVIVAFGALLIIYR